VAVDRVGRVQVEPDLSIPGRPEVFVVGDMAVTRQKDGRLVPGVAQGAIQEAPAPPTTWCTLAARGGGHYVNKGTWPR
jgi:NADH dehydrogenase FAD-containing subunit